MITSYSRELMLGIPQGTLIDLETTGLDVNHDEIVLFGYIQGSRLEIICRNSQEEAPFIAQLTELVDGDGSRDIVGHNHIHPDVDKFARGNFFAVGVRRQYFFG